MLNHKGEREIYIELCAWYKNKNEVYVKTEHEYEICERLSKL